MPSMVPELPSNHALATAACCCCCLQGDAPGCKGSYVVLSGRLSDVRGFNDFLQDFLVQVCFMFRHAGASCCKHVVPCCSSSFSHVSISAT